MGIDRAVIERGFEIFGKTLPLGRVGEGEDIAKIILFLASNDSAFITSECLLADGGQLAANASVEDYLKTLA